MALRKYSGRSIDNSVSGETEKLKKLLAIAKKYSTMLILLQLSDAGLLANLAENIAIIDKIARTAHDAGLGVEDIVIGRLVTTIGANPFSTYKFLETIQYRKKNQFSTIREKSNISFGLPEKN